jgi:NAD(P)-dependent dehydrogenase (short-subunit alcohol dehydrogenase family)
VFAAPLLFAAKAGQSHPPLIAHVSSFGARVYAVNVAYGVGKAGVDRMASDMAVELKPHGVASVSLWPGVVKTERILRGEFPYSTEGAESPTFSGRAVAALAADPKLLERTGKPLVVAELALEYGFTDIDGSQPKSRRKNLG